MATFGLIHGAWHGAWCWDRLVPELRSRGHDVRTMDLPIEDPEADFDDYVRVVVEALAGAADPVVLVGHSLGGVLLPLVAARRPVARQVYLAAILHPALVPAGAPGPHAPGTFAALERFPDRSHRWPTLAAAAPVLYSDCAPEDAAWAFGMLRRQQTALPWARLPTAEPASGSPVSSIVCSRDRTVLPAWSTWAANEVLGVEPTLLDAGHSPFLSRPAALAEPPLPGVAGPLDCAVAEPRAARTGDPPPRGESRDGREGRPAWPSPTAHLVGPAGACGVRVSVDRSGRARRLDATLRRNLGIDIASGAGVGLMMALVGVLVPVVARRGGLDALGLAVLATGPFVANVLALFAGRLGARSPRSLASVRAAGGLALVLMLPLAGPVALAALVLLFWTTVALAAPYQMRLWGAIYPAGARGRFIGIVGTGRSAAAAAGSLVGGVLADRIGGLEVVALGGVVGMILGSTAAGYLAPRTDDGPAYDLRRSMRAITGSPRLWRITLAQMFMGGGFVAAGPLFAFVYVDKLHLSLSEVGVLGILTAGATTVAYLPWGDLVDRRGGLPAFQVGSLLGATALVLYAWGPSYAVLGIAAILTGLCNASVEMGSQAVIAEYAPPSERPAAMAGWAAINGVRGIAAPFIVTTLLAFGVVSVTGGILLGAVTTSVGAVIYAFAGRVAAGPTAPALAAEPHRLGG